MLEGGGEFVKERPQVGLRILGQLPYISLHLFGWKMFQGLPQLLMSDWLMNFLLPRVPHSP